MQVQDIFLEDIKPLKFCYIFHFILYVLIFILHFIIYNKLFWIKNAFQIIFSFSTYFIILFYIRSCSNSDDLLSLSHQQDCHDIHLRLQR
jgi:hypothetical protein